MVGDLTKEEIAGLTWMARVNPKMGFLCQFVRRRGPVPEYERLIATNMARLVTRRQYGDKMGYWILPRGRDALEKATGSRSP